MLSRTGSLFSAAAARGAAGPARVRRMRASGVGKAQAAATATRSGAASACVSSPAAANGAPRASEGASRAPREDQKSVPHRARADIQTPIRLFCFGDVPNAPPSPSQHLSSEEEPSPQHPAGRGNASPRSFFRAVLRRFARAGSPGTDSEAPDLARDVGALVEEVLVAARRDCVAARAAMAEITAFAKTHYDALGWRVYLRVHCCMAAVASEAGEYREAAGVLEQEVLPLLEAKGALAASVHMQALLAWCHAGCGDIDAALLRFDAALKLASANPTAQQYSAGTPFTAPMDIGNLFLSYAALLTSAGRDADAAAVLQRAVRMPQSPARRAMGMLMAGRALRRSGRVPEAIAVLEELVAERADAAHPPTVLFSAPEYELALCHHYGRGSDEAAIPLYNKASSVFVSAILEIEAKQAGLEPSAGAELADMRARTLEMYGHMLYDAGLCYEGSAEHGGPAAAAGVFAEAIKVFRKCDLSDRTARVRLNYARALLGLQQVDRALEEYAESLRILLRAPNGPQVSEHHTSQPLDMGEVHCHIAHCYFYNVGVAVSAERHYLQAMEHTGLDCDGTTAEAVLGDTPLQPAVAGWLLEGYATLLMNRSAFAEAFRLLKARIVIGEAQSPPDLCVDAYTRLAACLEKMSKATGASDATVIYHALLRLPVDALEPLQKYGLVRQYATLCQAKGEYEAACELFEAALALVPINPEVRVQYATCLQHLPFLNEQLVAQQLEAAVTTLELHKEAVRNEEPSLDQRPPQEWDAVYIYGECAVFNHEVRHDLDVAKAYYTAALEHADACPNRDNAAQVVSNFAVMQFSELGDFAAAATLFQRALALAPKKYEVLTAYADFLVHKGDNDAALEMIKGMLTDFPHNQAYVFYLYARVQSVVTPDDVDTVVDLFLKSMGVDPTSVDDATAAANRAAAEVHLQSEAGDVDPQAAAAHSERARAAFKQERCDTILSAMLRCENSQIAQTLLQYLATRTLQYPLIQRCYLALLRRFPEDASLRVHYAWFLGDVMGLRSAAKKQYTAALRAYPANTMVISRFAGFLSQKYPERPEDAEKLFMYALRVRPDDVSLMGQYASFLSSELYSPKKALALFTKALALAPADGALHAMFGKFLERFAAGKGKAFSGYAAIMEEARGHFKASVTHSPNSANAHLLYGAFLGRDARFTDAWDHLRAALEIDPQNVPALQTAANFLTDWYAHLHNANAYGTGDGDKSQSMQAVAQAASSFFKRAIHIDPASPALLSCYSQFLLNVMKDPARSAEVSLVASQLERAQAAARQASLDAAEGALMRDDGEPTE